MSVCMCMGVGCLFSYSVFLFKTKPQGVSPVCLIVGRVQGTCSQKEKKSFPSPVVTGVCNTISFSCKDWKWTTNVAHDFSLEGWGENSFCSYLSDGDSGTLTWNATLVGGVGIK